MKWGRGILIIFGALVITALGIDAADTIKGNEGTLLSQVIGTKSTGCPSGMVAVATVPTISCVDAYEASPSSKCPSQNPEQVLSTQENLSSTQCTPDSKNDATPWRFVTRDQAMQLCARAGKRLPTNAEWYSLTLGMANVETGCNVASKNVLKTGAKAECVSPNGVFDLIGNVWEWVSDDVIDGMYNARAVPESGYVAQVDASGVATGVATDPQDLFGKDYFWSRTEGAFGIIRGGYYDSGSDAGLYVVHADTPPTTAGTGIGFRCVK